jgi:putative addiction module component (TIGR02574 family)
MYDDIVVDNLQEDNMEPDKIASEINNLSIPQKLILIQDVWDSIALESGMLPMQEWQKVELAKRHNEYKEGKLDLSDWQDVHNDLRKNYR